MGHCFLIDIMLYGSVYGQIQFIQPETFSILANWFPKKELGKASGFVQAGFPLGIAMTMPIATWIIQIWNWQTLFHIFAFLGPVWYLVWWKFGEDSLEQVSILKF